MITRSESTQTFTALNTNKDYSILIDFMHESHLSLHATTGLIPRSKYEIAGNTVHFFEYPREYHDQILQLRRATPKDLDFELERGNHDLHAIERALDRITLMFQEVTGGGRSPEEVSGSIGLNLRLICEDSRAFQRSPTGIWNLTGDTESVEVDSYDAMLGFGYGDDTLGIATNVQSGYQFGGEVVFGNVPRMTVTAEWNTSLLDTNTSSILGLNRPLRFSSYPWVSGYLNSNFLLEDRPGLGTSPITSFQFEGHDIIIVAVLFLYPYLSRRQAPQDFTGEGITTRIVLAIPQDLFNSFGPSVQDVTNYRFTRLGRLLESDRGEPIIIYAGDRLISLIPSQGGLIASTDPIFTGRVLTNNIRGINYNYLQLSNHPNNRTPVTAPIAEGDRIILELGDRIAMNRVQLRQSSNQRAIKTPIFTWSDTKPATPTSTPAGQILPQGWFVSTATTDRTGTTLWRSLATWNSSLSAQGFENFEEPVQADNDCITYSVRVNLNDGRSLIFSRDYRLVIKEGEDGM